MEDVKERLKYYLTDEGLFSLDKWINFIALIRKGCV